MAERKGENRRNFASPRPYVLSRVKIKGAHKIVVNIPPKDRKFVEEQGEKNKMGVREEGGSAGRRRVKAEAVPALRLKSNTRSRTFFLTSLLGHHPARRPVHLSRRPLAVVSVMDVDPQDVHSHLGGHSEQRTNALAGPSSQPDMPVVFLPPSGLYPCLLSASVKSLAK